MYIDIVMLVFFFRLRVPVLWQVNHQLNIQNVSIIIAHYNWDMYGKVVWWSYHQCFHCLQLLRQIHLRQVWYFVNLWSEHSNVIAVNNINHLLFIKDTATYHVLTGNKRYVWKIVKITLDKLVLLIKSVVIILLIRDV